MNGVPYYDTPVNGGVSDSSGRYYASAEDLQKATGGAASPPANTSGPTFTIGQSDGGPGAWTQVNESMSDAARAYQQNVTGAPQGVTYNVPNPNAPSGVTSFDGYDPATNTLIDAKFWNGWPIEAAFSSDSVIQMAERQVQAASASGANIQWVVPSQATATAITNIFDGNGITGITIIIRAP